jgi:hypothetical protein
MSLLSSVKNFLLPTDKEARNRRIDVFGTPSKAVAGTAIVGAAAAAIAAPVVIAGGGLRTLGSAIAGTSLKTKVVGGSALLLAGPVVTGAIVNEPKVVTRTLGGLTNFQGNLYELGKNPSVENVTDLVKENPVIAGIVAGGIAAGTGLAGAGASALLSSANTSAVRQNTAALESGTLQNPSISSLPIQSNALVAPNPVTAGTQTLSSVRSTSVVRKRRPVQKIQPIRNTVRVQVLNQNNYKVRR